MQLWQAEQRDERALDKQDDAALKPITRGTLAADVTAYLKTREGREGWKADRSHLKAWTDRYGKLPRHRIGTKEVEAAISAWTAAKKSPRTIKHRIRVLKELWHYHDGRKARTPADAVKLRPPVKTIPIPVTQELILAVAESLQRGLIIRQRCGHGRKRVAVRRAAPVTTHARFLIRAITGQRPSQVGRAKPEHVDRENRIWWVQPGKGGHPVPFPLIEELDLAFQLFDQVDAWGPFNPSAFSKTIKRHGWPARVRPYMLRHTFAIKQLLAGVDLGDLQGLLGHTNPNTTRIYAPVLVARLREAIQKSSTLTLVKKKAG